MKSLKAIRPICLAISLTCAAAILAACGGGSGVSSAGPALRGLFSSYGEPVIFVFIGIGLLIISRLLQRSKIRRDSKGRNIGSNRVD